MKKYKKLTIINLSLILSAVFIPILLMVIVYYFILPDNYFFEDKYFKSIHMSKVQEDKDTDIIFIGSSRTQNHISTAQFEKKGYDVYTYGRPSMLLSDFPFPVKKSLELNPKYIFLMIDIRDLYLDINMKFPTYEDRVFYNKNFSYSTSNEYLVDKYRIKDLFRAGKRFIMNDYYGLHSKYFNSYDKGLTDLIDCNIIDWRGIIGQRSVALCGNGNGIVFDNKELKVKKSAKNYNVKNISNQKIELLNELIVMIKSKNITPIVVLEPIAYNIYIDYKSKEYSEIIDSKIMFLSNFEVHNHSLWVDKAHFNIHGRAKYTKKLIEEFETILHAEQLP